MLCSLLGGADKARNYSQGSEHLEACLLDFNVAQLNCPTFALICSQHIVFRHFILYRKFPFLIDALA